MRHPQPARFDLDTALQRLAAEITWRAASIADAGEPRVVLQVDWRGSDPYDHGFALRIDVDGKIAFVQHSVEGKRVTTPSALLGMRTLGEAGTRVYASPADPRVLAGLRRLDRTALFSLRELRGFDLESYAVLRDLGEAAPINRFLADHPCFAGWLHRGWLDRDHDLSDETVLSDLPTSPDPQAWIVEEIARTWAGRWPHRPCDRAAIEATVAAVLQTPSANITVETLQPTTLMLLAACPEAQRPQPGDAVVDALHWAIVAIDLVTLPQIEPETVYASFDGDWSRHREALERHAGHHLPAFAHASLHQHAVALLAHALGTARTLRNSRTLNLLADIVETRLVAVFSENRPGLFRYLNGLSDLFEAMIRTRADSSAPLLASEMLPPAMRDLSPQALLTALGFDLAAIVEVLEADHEMSERDVQARILAEPHRSPRRTRSDILCGPNAFHTATIDGRRYQAYMTYRGPVIGQEPWQDGRTIEYDPNRAFGPYRLTEPYDPDEPVERVQGIVDAFHREFGLATCDVPGRDERGHDFYGSRAAAGLKAWVTRCPRLARACHFDPHAEINPVIGDWYGWATAQEA